MELFLDNNDLAIRWSDGSCSELLTSIDDRHSEISCTPDSSDRFYFPIDRCFEIDQENLRFPADSSCIIWDNGRIQGTFHYGQLSTVIHGNVELEFSVSGTKVYLTFTGGPISITRGTDLISVDLHPCSQILLGVDTRASDRPIIHTEPTVDGVLDAISRLGGVYDSFTPARSLPGDRPAPPTVLTDGAVDEYSDVSIPDHPVSIELAGGVAEAFTIAPLAYYIGAEVTVSPDDTTKVLVEDRVVGLGFESVGVDQRVPGETLGESVQVLLHHLRALDSIVRADAAIIPSGKDADLLSYIQDEGFAFVAGDVSDCEYIDQLHRYLDIPVGLLEFTIESLPSAGVVPYPENITAVSHILQELMLLSAPPAVEEQRSLDVLQSVSRLYSA